MSEEMVEQLKWWFFKYFNEVALTSDLFKTDINILKSYSYNFLQSVKIFRIVFLVL